MHQHAHFHVAEGAPTIYPELAMLRWLLKALPRTVLAPGSRGGHGFRGRGGRWRYGEAPTSPQARATSTPPIDQAREVAQRLWGTDVDVRDAGGRCQVVRTTAGRETLLADEATWSEALAAAKAAHQGPEAPVAMVKAATAKPPKGKTPPLLRFAPPPEADGQHPLGTTRRGKPIHASGAEAKGYNPDDHQDAAALHHKVAVHHEARAEAHRTASAEDLDSWQRAEMHHQESERHGKLATHHRDVARDHLIAGGHGGTQAMALKDGALQPGALVPHGVDEQQAARERLGKRTHWSHPGGMTPRDRQAYMAKGGGAMLFRMTRGRLLKSGGEGSRGGHVIGHTRSGKAVYADSHKGTGSGGWHSQEHQDAASAHIDAGYSAFTAAGVADNADVHRRLRTQALAHQDATRHHRDAARRALVQEQQRGHLGITQTGKLIPGTLEPAHAYRSHGMDRWTREDHQRASALHHQRAVTAEPGAKLTVDYGPEHTTRHREVDARQHHETASAYHDGHASRLGRDGAAA